MDLMNIADRGDPQNSEKALRELLEQIERQSRMFNTTLSSITDFAYAFDLDGRFLFVNQALLNLWGLELKDALRKNFFDLNYPHELATKLQNQIQQVVETKQSIKDETPYTSPSGSTGYYDTV